MFAVVIRAYDIHGKAIGSEDVAEFATLEEANAHAAQQEKDYGHPDSEGNYCRWTVEAL